MAEKPKLNRDALHAAMGAAEREVREESATRRLLAEARREVAHLEEKVDLLTAIDGVGVGAPDWSVTPRTKRDRRAIANLVISDLHLDEVVKPEQVNGRNAYDRRIAELRLRGTVERTVRLARDYISGLSYDGLILWLGGDNVSGMIHDELRRTNAGQDVVDTIDYWVDPMASALSALADFFGKVHVVCEFGNHGRSTRKPEAKDAIRSNYDWLLCRILNRALRSDERISWTIPESLTVTVKVFETTYHFEHGDNFQGGDQIAGPIRPVMMGYYRRQASGDPFDLLICGHFHTYAAIPQAIMNGSLVGYTEYSARRGYRFEPPKQAFWIETPENGPAFHMPVLPADRRAEGW